MCWYCNVFVYTLYTFVYTYLAYTLVRATTFFMYVNCMLLCVLVLLLQKKDDDPNGKHDGKTSNKCNRKRTVRLVDGSGIRRRPCFFVRPNASPGSKLWCGALRIRNVAVASVWLNTFTFRKWVRNNVVHKKDIKKYVETNSEKTSKVKEQGGIPVVMITSQLRGRFLIVRHSFVIESNRLTKFLEDFFYIIIQLRLYR